jgi:hypothetical protein
MMRIGLLGQGDWAKDGAAIETAAAVAARWKARRDMRLGDMGFSGSAAIL